MSAWTLGRAAGDFISYVQLFRQAGAGNRADVAGLRAQLLALLDAFAKHPAARGAQDVELEEARFALVAWADEMVLTTEWSGRDAWSVEPLQLQLFRINRAGDEFFERLARLRAEQTDAREVFFLCLAFGFEGQLADRESERRALIHQQFEMLRVARRALDVASESPVTPPAYEVQIDLGGPRRSSIWRPLGVMLLLAGGVFALVFGVLWVYGAGVPGVPT